MPYVRRDADGTIVAVSRGPAEGAVEELPDGHPELLGFVGGEGADALPIGDTDQDFIRVLEDVVELLMDKGLILFTDLPESAQQKMITRQRLRSRLGDNLDLIGDD